MSRSVSTLIAALVVVVVLSIVLVSPAWSGKPALAEPPAPSVDGLSNQELVKTFNEASGSNPDRAMQLAQQLWQRRRVIERRDLISVLTDDSRPQETRDLMVDLLAGDPDESQVTDDVRDLLRGSSLDSELKARIIVSYRFDRTDSPLLSSLASSPEEPAAFHALKKLGEVDPEVACQLARATLSRAHDSSDSKLSAAYKVLIRSGTLKNDPATRGVLLRHLASVLAGSSTSPELRDSATFALADMRSLDAMRTLLESTQIDRAVVGGAIDQNALLIKTALEQNPDEPTIALAVAAMELHPVSDIAEPLRALRGRVKSPALGQRLEAALAHIANDGIPINPKWAED